MDSELEEDEADDDDLAARLRIPSLPHHACTTSTVMRSSNIIAPCHLRNARERKENATKQKLQENQISGGGGSSARDVLCEKEESGEVGRDAYSERSNECGCSEHTIMSLNASAAVLLLLVARAAAEEDDEEETEDSRMAVCHNDDRRLTWISNITHTSHITRTHTHTHHTSTHHHFTSIRINSHTRIYSRTQSDTHSQSDNLAAA